MYYFFILTRWSKETLKEIMILEKATLITDQREMPNRSFWPIPEGSTRPSRLYEVMANNKMSYQTPGVYMRTLTFSLRQKVPSSPLGRTLELRLWLIISPGFKNNDKLDDQYYIRTVFIYGLIYVSYLINNILKTAY